MLLRGVDDVTQGHSLKFGGPFGIFGTHNRPEDVCDEFAKTDLLATVIPQS